MPRSRLARSESHGGDYRQPECEERGKGGASIELPGFDAGKKIKGKKRHILVDTQGLLMHALVHAADIQDRDGGGLVMATLFGMFPFLLKLYADGGYQGPEFQRALKKSLARVNLEIVKRSDHGKGFVVLPKRWIVERTFAWLGRCRRLAQGLGEPHAQRARLPAPRLHPAHVAQNDACNSRTLSRRDSR